MAPEMLKPKKGHSFEVDIWSLGIIIFTLLTGYPPFKCDRVEETYRRIKNCTYEFPYNNHICPDAIDLLMRIFVSCPYSRPSLYEVENHPFLNRPGVIPITLYPRVLNRSPSIEYIYKHENYVQYQNSIARNFD